MNNSKEERLKIAVFIDFDNISIGVKQSLGRNFDVGTVLEAIKEKGQVVTKIAYGDWKRNEDFSRAMTQHAVQMVQRNLTPGGDKNGADIALALDALEMAFTRDHINAFVIVGGDSDFIALVEKLKQYDKTVFIVGGRAFTSVILQKNCHEFISYENLIGVQSGIKRSAGKTPAMPSPAPLETALPLIRRSLKILSDREVSPQLGLLKSTLLQLDSTFSERDYGVSSFRDFTQKLANAGYVNLKQVDRSLLVELKDVPDSGRTVQETPAIPSETAAQDIGPAPEQPSTVGPPSEATQVLQELLRESKTKPHWPLYLRSFKQFLKTLQPPFDEHQYGITSTYDLVRQAQKDGLLHVERNRQGILRIYPGELFPKATPETGQEETVLDGESGLETPGPEPEERVKTEEKSRVGETPGTKPAPGSPSGEASRTARPAKSRRKSSRSAKTGQMEAAKRQDKPDTEKPDTEKTGKPGKEQLPLQVGPDSPEIEPEKDQSTAVYFTEQIEEAGELPATEPKSAGEKPGIKTPAKKPAAKPKRKASAPKTTRTRKTVKNRKPKAEKVTEPVQDGE